MSLETRRYIKHIIIHFVRERLQKHDGRDVSFEVRSDRPIADDITIS